MTSETTILELDAAVSGNVTAAKLATEYPDASPDSIRRAKQIETLKQRIKYLAECHERQQKAELAAFLTAFQKKVRDVEVKSAAIAEATGAAGAEEKQLLKEARLKKRAASDIASIFNPETPNP